MHNSAVFIKLVLANHKAKDSKERIIIDDDNNSKANIKK